MRDVRIFECFRGVSLARCEGGRDVKHHLAEIVFYVIFKTIWTIWMITFTTPRASHTYLFFPSHLFPFRILFRSI